MLLIISAFQIICLIFAQKQKSFVELIVTYAIQCTLSLVRTHFVEHKNKLNPPYCRSCCPFAKCSYAPIFIHHPRSKYSTWIIAGKGVDMLHVFRLDLYVWIENLWVLSQSSIKCRAPVRSAIESRNQMEVQWRGKHRENDREREREGESCYSVNITFCWIGSSMKEIKSIVAAYMNL